MHFIIGLIIVALIIYFAFVRDKDDTDEDAVKKIAQTVVVLFIALVIVGAILLVVYDK